MVLIVVGSGQHGKVLMLTIMDRCEWGCSCRLPMLTTVTNRHTHHTAYRIEYDQNTRPPSHQDEDRTKIMQKKKKEKSLGQAVINILHKTSFKLEFD